MKYKWLTIIILLSLRAAALPLTEKSRVSILTAEPGQELYTIFGHTAIRITDDSLDFDRVYNYGTFDFSSPFFYIRFLKGNLNYFLSIDDFKTYAYYTLQERRKIYEQVLDLSYSERVSIFNRLEECYNSDERFYRYDFFYDNCATRVRDVIFDAGDGRIQYDTSLYCCRTFRQLLKPYISINYWIDLCVNLALGKGADKMASSRDFMFLPDYIMNILDDSGLVQEKKVLLDASVKNVEKSSSSYYSVWVIILILSLSAIWKKTRKVTFYLVTSAIGIVGVILLLNGLFTENPAFQGNCNIYWTLPALILIFFRKGPLRNVIDIAYLSVLLLMLLLWNNLPQDFSATFIPWILLLLVLLVLDLQIPGRIFNSRH